MMVNTPESNEALKDLQQQVANPQQKLWHKQRELTQKFVMDQLFDPKRRPDEDQEAYKQRRKLAKRAEKNMLRGTPLLGFGE